MRKQPFCSFTCHRSKLETRGHYGSFVNNSSNTRPISPPNRAPNSRTSAGSAFTTSPAFDAGPGRPCAPSVIQPCTTARSAILPGSARLPTSSSCNDFCASPFPDLSSPSNNPEHCPHAADLHDHDQSECT